MLGKSRPDGSRWILGRSLPLAWATSAVAFMVTQLISPFWGAFAVSAALSYVASDLLISFFVKFGPNWVKVGGNRFFTTRANAFWVFLIFVVVFSPIVAFTVEYAIPLFYATLTLPALVDAATLSALAPLAVAGDVLYQVR